ncbi:hypothetical protein SLA2020_247670, partial [Shorea laevis]
AVSRLDIPSNALPYMICKCYDCMYIIFVAMSSRRSIFRAMASRAWCFDNVVPCLDISTNVVSCLNTSTNADRIQLSQPMPARGGQPMPYCALTF